MYDPEKIDQFILMRSHGMTIRQIADAMQVSKSTVQEWCIKYNTEINDSRDEAYRAVLTEIGMSKIERVKALGFIYKHIFTYISKETTLYDREQLLALFLKIHRELNGEENWSHVKTSILRNIAVDRDMVDESTHA